MSRKIGLKIALYARALNELTGEDKYQMPSLDNLIHMVAEKLDEKKEEVWYSSVNMTYAYGQFPLLTYNNKNSLQS